MKRKIAVNQKALTTYKNRMYRKEELFLAQAKNLVRLYLFQRRLLPERTLFFALFLTM